MIHHGDCLEIMKSMPDNSIDSIITDPPYGISFMGKDWDHGVPGVPYWAEMLRIAKPGATLLAFGGTRTFHRLTCAIEDAGWDIRDCLMWLYGSGFPKSQDIGKLIDKKTGAAREVVGYEDYTVPELANDVPFGQGFIKGSAAEIAGRELVRQPVPITAPATDLAKQFNGYQYALKPAWEPIIMAMKPTDGSYANNAAEWGVAGLNIDECRVGTGGKHRDGEESQDRRYNEKGGTNFAMKPGPRGGDPKGRFPANLMLDEEAAAQLDEQSGIAKPKIGRQGKRGGNGFGFFDDEKSSSAEGVWPDDPGGGASRFFYCSKAPKSERNGSKHPTVKPLKLMEYLCTLTKTPTGGVVLDPFAGTGTTLLAARNTGREFIGIEMEAEYIEDIKRRLAA